MEHRKTLQCLCQALFVTVTSHPVREEEHRDHSVFAEEAIQTTWHHQDVWDAREMTVRMVNKHAPSCNHDVSELDDESDWGSSQSKFKVLHFWLLTN